jgi:hypothetical protein
MIPLCRWPLPRLCGFPSTGCRRRLFGLSAASSRRASPSFRVLPSNTYPTAAAVRSSHGLLVPTALEGSEVHFTRVEAARYVPSSGFGYPLDGLLPRIPGRFCFTPAALLGFTLRRFPFRKASAIFRPGRAHLPLAWQFLCRRSVRPAQQASVSGIAPPRSAL